MKLYLLNFTTKVLLLKNVMSIYENYSCTGILVLKNYHLLLQLISKNIKFLYKLA